ncbi:MULTISPECIES: META domain-containing protein [unclassified Afipia]|uniref:META domain-containing protein n=2 Tax=Afipia TaxID=1033 RepID=UPI001FCBC6EE|nr:MULTISPECIES: META domain-containing protein [unclassified Afipia]
MMSTRFTALAVLTALLTGLVAAGSAAPTGKWRAEDIDGGGVIDRLQTTLEIGDDGMVTGMGGCNRYAGSAKFDATTIKFLPMASTRMACSPAVMKQESKFHATLEKVRAWRVDQVQRKLVLLDGQGFEMMRLSQMD